MNNAITESIKLDQKAIGQLAYQLWDKAGRPSGQDLDFWLEAERQLRAAASQTVPTIPVKLPTPPAKATAPEKPAKAKLSPSRLGRR